MRGRAKPRAATVALLLARRGGAAGAPRRPRGPTCSHPRTARRQNAQKTDDALQDRLLHRHRRDRPRSGRSSSTRCSASAPGAAAQAPQISGNTPLELGWTVGATAIVVAITIVTYIYPGRHHATRWPPGPESVAEARGQYADHQPAAAARRQGRSRSRCRASSTCGATSTRTRPCSFHEMVVPRDTDGDADAEGQRRRSTRGGSRRWAASWTPSRATRTRPGSRRPRPARSRASAPSCAAPATTR